MSATSYIFQSNILTEHLRGQNEYRIIAKTRVKSWKKLNGYFISHVNM